MVDSCNGSFGSFLFRDGVFEVEKIEPLVAKLLVIFTDKFSFDKLAFVGKLGGEAFALGFYDNHLVNISLFGSAQHQEVGHILAYVSPRFVLLFVAIYLKLSQRVVAIEVYFQILAFGVDSQCLRN